MGCSTSEMDVKDVKDNSKTKPITPGVKVTNISNPNNQENDNKKKENIIASPKQELNDFEKQLISKFKFGLCKVIYKEKGSSSTGILCRIPFPDKKALLPVLITSHFSTEDYFQRGKEIVIQLNAKLSKTLNLNLERKKFFNKNDKIIVIELLLNDGFDKNDFDSFLNVYEYKKDNKKQELLKSKVYAFYLESDLSLCCIPASIEYVDGNNFIYEYKGDYNDYIIIEINTFTLIGFYEMIKNGFKKTKNGFLMDKIINEFKIDYEINNGERLSIEYIILEGETSIRIFGEEFVRKNKNLCKYKNIDADNEWKEIFGFYNCIRPYNQHVKLRVELAGEKILQTFLTCSMEVIILYK